MKDLTDRQKAEALVMAGECDDLEEASAYLKDMGDFDDDGTLEDDDD